MENNPLKSAKSDGLIDYATAFVAMTMTGICIKLDLQAHLFRVLWVTLRGS